MMLSLDTRPVIRAALLSILTGTVLAGCASTSKGGGGTDHPATASAGWAAREEIGEAIQRLNKGDAPGARKILNKVVKKQPGDTVAASLIRQIDEDPVKLLGRESFAYTLKASDSLSALAQRYLGNPMLFYALARYNDIPVPETLTPGRVIRIPGRERPAPIAPRRAAPAEPKRPAVPPSHAEPPVPRSSPAPAPAKPSLDPARAARLRAAALEQMNRGAIDRAVALLRQARQLDPNNQPVARDLERALRIQKTIAARR